MLIIQFIIYLLVNKKKNSRKKSLIKIKDNYRKIIIVKDSIKSYFTEEGIEVISLADWLLN